METKNQLRIGGILLSAALVTGVLVSSAGAVVKGNCATCHTMHNSQDGGTQAAVGTGAGWNGTNMTGGTNNGPQAMLLVSDCVGCHSNQGTETILPLNGNNIPIVYNLGSYPSNALAGGNFNMVASNDQYGHNVFGISNPDTLTIAPGAIAGLLSSCASTCHASLALSDAATVAPGKPEVNGRNGCRACHVAKHHDQADTSYRFLQGHNGMGNGLVNVVGIEDPSGTWEQTPSQANHNVYGKLELQADDTWINKVVPGAIPGELTVSRFCTGCHSVFHSAGTSESSVAPLLDNGGPTGSPWLRHPSEAPIPNSGEFASMPAAYNPAIPVGKDLSNPNPTQITLGSDHVICISCHRAHGSDQPDMLRFDYSLMQVGAGGAASGTGCFFCHTTKD